MQKIGQYVRIEDSVAVVEVEGPYYLNNIGYVKKEYDEAIRMGCTIVRFDFAHTDYIESSVCREIYRLLRQIGEKNVQLVNANGRVYAAFHAAAMDKYLTMTGGGKPA